MEYRKNHFDHRIQDNYDTVVIGAGPAGLMAAIESYSPGKRIMVLEHMKRPALKLRITGSGSCNITNNRDMESFMEGFGRNGRFLRSVFSRFFSRELLEYFEHLGVGFSLERGGRYYPDSGKAEAVVQALLGKIEELEIPIHTGIHAGSIQYQKDENFSIGLSWVDSGKPKTPGKKISSEFLVIATGGRSYPATGSDGSGYALAEGLGHTIVPQIPALVPLKVRGNIPELLNNLTIKNCSVSIYRGEKKTGDRFGDIEFRDNEAAGPVLLKLSEKIVRMVKDGNEVSIGIDMKPSLEHDILDKRILRETSGKSNHSYEDVLKQLVPNKVVQLFMQITGVDPSKRPEHITRGERKELIRLLKDLRIGIKGSAPFSKALVTAGGVMLKEVDQKTMESIRVPGLYFAGEVMDLNGDTGGYNLQAAFSTGWMAGRSIKEKYT